MKIRKDDSVIVITGKDKGKTGKVLRAFPKEGKVIVEGVNIQTKHQKPMGPQKPGGLIKREGKIDVSTLCTTILQQRHARELAINSLKMALK